MNSIYNLQQGRAKLDKLQEKVALGANINRPSDDPIGSSMLLSVGDQLKAGEHYASNINKANTFMQVTSTALQGMADTMQLAKQLIANIPGNSTDATELSNTLSQLTTLKSQIMDMGNTQMGNQYVFGGANNNIKPFNQYSGTLTQNSDTVTNIDVTGLSKGMEVSGPGIPAGTKILAVTQPVAPATTGSFTLADSNGNPVYVDATILSTLITPPAVNGSFTLNINAGDSTQSNVEISSGNTQKMNIPGNQVLLGAGGVLKTGDLSNNIALNQGSINNVDVTGLSSGMIVSGYGIPAGTKIGVVTQPVAPAATGSFTLVDSNGNAVTVVDSAGVAVPAATPLTARSIMISPPYGSTNILKTFDDLITAFNSAITNLSNSQPVSATFSTALRTGAQALENGADQITKAQTDMASWMTRLDSASKMNTNSKTTLETIVSNTQNVDYAKLAVELTQQQTAFQASLSATAKVTQLSLLDYMQ